MPKVLEAVKNGRNEKGRVAKPETEVEDSDNGQAISKDVNARIPAPKMMLLETSIRGTGPFVQARFSEKARNTMAGKMVAGSTAKKGGPRAARDFDEDFKQSMHRGPNGENGMPASAFRAAAISACRIVGFKMTQAKLGFFVEADFHDPRDGTPLVAINGTPESLTLPVRNATGVADLRVRAIWHTWDARLRVRYDGDMFTDSDAINLLIRVGMQVGIGEGRPDSKKSAGMGWGTFELVGDAEVHAMDMKEMGLH